MKRLKKGTGSKRGGGGSGGKRRIGTRTENREPEAGFVDCPSCGKGVKEKNIEAHLRKVHRLSPSEAKEEVRSLIEGPGKKGDRGVFVLPAMAVIIVVIVVALVYVLVFHDTSDGNDVNDEGPKDYKEVTFDTEDGWLLYGDFYEPKAYHSTVILVHGMNEDRKVWRDGLAKDLYERGYGVLSYDIRGHGQSRYLNGKYIGVLSREDTMMMANDIGAAMDLLVSKGAAKNGVTIVGASIGANAAAVYTLEDARVNNLILLSPGDDYQGIRPMEAIRDFDGTVLFAAAYGDDIAYESCGRFMENATKATAKDFRYIPFGLYHGTGLLRDESIYNGVLEWIEDNP